MMDDARRNSVRNIAFLYIFERVLEFPDLAVQFGLATAV